MFCFVLGILGPSHSLETLQSATLREHYCGDCVEMLSLHEAALRPGTGPLTVTSDSYCYLLGPIIYLFHGWHEAESCMNNNQANNIFYTTFEQKYKWKISMMGKIVNVFGSHQVSIEVKIIIGVGYWMWVKRAGTIMG